MSVNEFLFWVFLLIILYAYFGYMGLLYIILIFKKNKIINTNNLYLNEDDLPEVTIFISAYNEKDFISKKIKNTNEINYPKIKIKQLWITDGSNDGSDEILKSYPEIILLHEKERRGKSNAINRGMTFVNTPIVVFCDANTMLSEDCILNMVKYYKNPKIGCVAGEKRIIFEEKEKAVGSGEGIYWKYESVIKKIESDIHSTISAAGELYSIQKELFKPIPDDTIIDDFVISLNIAKQGYQIKYEPEAFAFETSSINIKEEMKRKIRIATGGIQTFLRFTELFNFFKYGFLSFQYISHKVLRWIFVPFSFLLIFIFNIILLKVNILYLYLFFAQILFYLIVILGGILKNIQIKAKILFVPYYIFIMNFSIILGYFRYISGKHTVNWEKARRV